MDQSTIIAIFITLGGGLFFWILPAFVSPAELLSLWVTSYSRKVALTYRIFVVCPQKTIYSAPDSTILLNMLVCAAVLWLYGIFGFTLFFFCTFPLLFIPHVVLAYKHSQHSMAIRYFEDYCIVYAFVKRHSQEEAAKFQWMMVSVESTAEISKLISAMTQYVQNQPSEHNA